MYRQHTGLNVGTNLCPPSFSHESLAWVTHENCVKKTSNDIVDVGPLREATIDLQSK